MADDEARVELEARALSSPLRLRILRLCRFDARTNKEIADLLDMNPGTTLHHLRTLVEAGMLEAQPERPGARGSREVPYRSTGRSWRAPVPNQSVVLLETMRQQLEGVDPERIDVAWLGLRLSPEHKRELDERVRVLLEDFIARGPDEGGDPYSVVVVVHPDLNPPG